MWILIILIILFINNSVTNAALIIKINGMGTDIGDVRYREPIHLCIFLFADKMQVSVKRNVITTNGQRIRERTLVNHLIKYVYTLLGPN